jgi:hypothetical protein
MYYNFIEPIQLENVDLLFFDIIFSGTALVARNIQPFEQT